MQKVIHKYVYMAIFKMASITIILPELSLPIKSIRLTYISTLLSLIFYQKIQIKVRNIILVLMKNSLMKRLVILPRQLVLFYELKQALTRNNICVYPGVPFP